MSCPDIIIITENGQVIVSNASPNSVSITNGNINTNVILNNNVVSVSNNNQVDIVSIGTQGPSGPAGPAGPLGPIGPQGPQGNPGISVNGLLIGASGVQVTYNYAACTITITATGQGSGSGSVTSVGLSAPTEFVVSGSPVVSSGVLLLTKACELPNSFWSGPENPPAVYHSGGTFLRGICAGPDGNLYFTLQGTIGGGLNRITTGGVITSGIAAGIAAWGCCAGPDGNIWFCARTDNTIVKYIIASNTYTAYNIPTGNSQPEFICAGPDGNLWFTEFNGNKIGVISTAGSFLHEYVIPTNSSGPQGICSDGVSLWFCESGGGNIGKITTGGSFTEYSLPSGAPNFICLGPDNNLWFTNSSSNKVGSITTAGSPITMYTIPTSNSQPYGICSYQGSLWFTENNAGKIGNITTSGIITEITIPETNPQPTDICVGADSNLWIAEFNTTNIRSYNPCIPFFRPIYGTDLSLPIQSASGINISLSDHNNGNHITISAPTLISNMTMPAEFNVSNAYQTITVTKANENANTVWAGPTSGGAAQPTFRSIQGQDLSTILGASGIQVGLSGNNLLVSCSSLFQGNNQPAFSSNSLVGVTQSGTNYTGYQLLGNNINVNYNGNTITLSTQAATSVGITVPSELVTTHTGINTTNIVKKNVQPNTFYAGFGTILPNASAYNITTYAGASGYWDIPGSLCVGSDNNIWFIGTDVIGTTYSINSITTSGTIITKYTAPIQWILASLCLGSDGNIWFGKNLGSTSQIGKITVSGIVTLYTVPSPLVTPLVLGPDNNIWFASTNATFPGVYNINTDGQYTQITGGSNRNILSLGPDGNLWGSYSNGVTRISTTGTITQFPIPNANTINQMCSDVLENIWVSDQFAGKLTSISTINENITQYTLPASGGPLCLGPDNNIWFASSQNIGGLTTSKIGFITNSGVMTILSPTITGSVNGICAGASGGIWYTDSGTNPDSINNIITTGNLNPPFFREIIGADLVNIVGASGVQVTVSGNNLIISASSLAGGAHEPANTFYAGPTSGGAAIPTFRIIDSHDLNTVIIGANGIDISVLGTQLFVECNSLFSGGDTPLFASKAIVGNNIAGTAYTGYTLIAGAGMTIAYSGNNITFSASGGGSSTLSASGYFPPKGAGGLQLSTVAATTYVESPYGTSLDPTKRVYTLYSTRIAAAQNPTFSDSANTPGFDGLGAATIITQNGYIITPLNIGTNAGVSDAAINNGLLTYTQYALLPFITYVISVSTNSNIRFWVGLGSAALKTSDTIAANSVAFRYSTNAGTSDSTIKFITSDGSASNIIDTGIALNANTPLVFQIDMTNPNKIIGYINGTQVGSSSTHLPVNTTNLAFYASQTNLGTTAGTSMGFGMMKLETY